MRSQGLVSVCLLMKARVLSLSVRSEILPGMIHSVQKNIKQKKIVNSKVCLGIYR